MYNIIVEYNFIEILVFVKMYIEKGCFNDILIYFIICFLLNILNCIL